MENVIGHPDVVSLIVTLIEVIACEESLATMTGCQDSCSLSRKCQLASSQSAGTLCILQYTSW
jgi:hypothetical protein